MKVVALNGSPNAKGNTYTAMTIVAEALAKEGIETEILHVGGKAVRGCIVCGHCSNERDGRCSISDDIVNEAIEKMRLADGILLGSPVYFSGIAGTMKCFLDRVFYVASKNGSPFRHKVGASLVVARRAGASATFDQLNHYLSFAEMAVATSNYWNNIHGRAAGEALQDTEGVQTMRVLGQNMAWLIKLIENGRGKVSEPAREEKTLTHFIR